METKIDSINKMIRRLGNDEQDPPVREFFHILSQISSEDSFKNILTRILEKRLHITEEHLAYLIYISLQYITNFAYDDKPQKEKLESDLIDHSDKIIKLCQTKYASTNVLERYALLQIILAMLNKPCVVIDLGASIGVGLMALNAGTFSGIKIDPELKCYLKKKAEISKALGIDVQRPDLKWQLACYLPENKKDRMRLERIYNQLKVSGTKITLLQGDILNLDEIPLPKMDVIWTSNVLYQIEGTTDKLTKNILNLLKEDGVWVNADYRHENKKFATPENPYVAMVRRKEKWNKILEVLEAPSDVVRSVKPGHDFGLFKQACIQTSTTCSVQ